MAEKRKKYKKKQVSKRKIPTKKKVKKKYKREQLQKKKAIKKKAKKKKSVKSVRQRKVKAPKRRVAKRRKVKASKRRVAKRRKVKVYKRKSAKSRKIYKRKSKIAQKKRVPSKVRKRARKKVQRLPRISTIPPAPIVTEEEIVEPRISTIPPAPIVTEEEIVEPIRITVPAKPSRVPIYDIESGEEKMFSEEGIPESSEHYMNSSNASKKEMSGVTIGGVERVADIFEKAFERSLAKGPFEADEVNIFRHGVIIRPRNGGEPNEAIKEKLNEMLQDVPGAAVHITDEHGTFSIRIGIGSPTEAANAEQASDNLRKHSEKFNDIFDYISGWYDDVDWFSFWDTDEAMY